MEHFLPCNIDLLNTESNAQPLDIMSLREAQTATESFTFPVTGLYLSSCPHTTSLVRLGLKGSDHSPSFSPKPKFITTHFSKKIFQIPSVLLSLLSIPTIPAKPTPSLLFTPAMWNRNTIQFINTVHSLFIHPFTYHLCARKSTCRQAGRPTCKAPVTVLYDGYQTEATPGPAEHLLVHASAYRHVFLSIWNKS